jgi:hypothetical protein
VPAILAYSFELRFSFITTTKKASTLSRIIGLSIVWNKAIALRMFASDVLLSIAIESAWLWS